MKILVIGAGVIGTIYGYALAQAGNDVTHYVRPGKKKSLENGINIKLLDGREEKPVERDVLYTLKVTESISPDHDYELILVSVRHYQMGLVLPLLKENAGKADVLFFNGLWDSFEIVDAYLPRSKYLWGFPVAGGGYHGSDLDAALLDEVHLGEVDGQRTPRVDRLSKMFNDAGLKVDVQDRMKHWLWVHFAINCGIIAAAFRAGGADELMNHPQPPARHPGQPRRPGGMPGPRGGRQLVRRRPVLQHAGPAGGDRGVGEDEDQPAGPEDHAEPYRRR